MTAYILECPLRRVRVTIGATASLTEAIPTSTVYNADPVTTPTTPDTIVKARVPSTSIGPGDNSGVGSDFFPDRKEGTVPSWTTPIWIPSTSTPLIDVVADMRVIVAPKVVTEPASAPFLPPSEDTSVTHPPVPPSQVSQMFVVTSVSSYSSGYARCSSIPCSFLIG